MGRAEACAAVRALHGVGEKQSAAEGRSDAPKRLGPHYLLFLFLLHLLLLPLGVPSSIALGPLGAALLGRPAVLGAGLFREGGSCGGARDGMGMVG